MIHSAAVKAVEGLPSSKVTASTCFAIVVRSLLTQHPIGTKRRLCHAFHTNITLQVTFMLKLMVIQVLQLLNLNRIGWLLQVGCHPIAGRHDGGS